MFSALLAFGGQWRSPLPGSLNWGLGAFSWENLPRGIERAFYLLADGPKYENGVIVEGSCGDSRRDCRPWGWSGLANFSDFFPCVEIFFLLYE